MAGVLRVPKPEELGRPPILTEERMEAIQCALEAAEGDWVKTAKALPEYRGHREAQVVNPEMGFTCMASVQLHGEHEVFLVEVELTLHEDTAEWVYAPLQRHGKRLRYRPSWKKREKR